MKDTNSRRMSQAAATAGVVQEGRGGRERTGRGDSAELQAFECPDRCDFWSTDVLNSVSSVWLSGSSRDVTTRPSRVHFDRRRSLEIHLFWHFLFLPSMRADGPRQTMPIDLGTSDNASAFSETANVFVAMFPHSHPRKITRLLKASVSVNTRREYCHKAH